MVDLVCTPFADHVARIHRELATQDAVYDLPRAKWYVPPAGGPDLAVDFHHHRAANPVGPAAGPHGQMAQNLVLSYLAGGRIMELKTVQVNDRLTIPRPCIDATNVGYNVEWSQELRLTESLHEYVGGAMLVHMIRRGGFFPTDAGDLAGPAGDVIYDMSVGYDLAGFNRPPCGRSSQGCSTRVIWLPGCAMRYRLSMPTCAIWTILPVCPTPSPCPRFTAVPRTRSSASACT
jgi:putative selenate reductase